VDEVADLEAVDLEAVDPEAAVFFVLELLALAALGAA